MWILRDATLTIKLDPQTADLAERYIAVLEGAQQREIDAATEVLTSARQRLNTSTDNLQKAIEGSK